MGSVPFSRLQCIQSDKPSTAEESLFKTYGLETGTVGEAMEKSVEKTTMSGFELELDSFLMQHLNSFKPIIKILY